MKKLNGIIAKAQIKEAKQLETMEKFKDIQLQGLPSQCLKINEQILRLDGSFLKLLLSYILGRAKTTIKLRVKVIDNIDDLSQQQIQFVDVLIIQNHEIWFWMRLDKNQTVQKFRHKITKASSQLQRQQYLWSAQDKLDTLIANILSFLNACGLKKQVIFINQQYLCNRLNKLKEQLIKDLKQCFIFQANSHLLYLQKQEQFLLKARQMIQNISEIPTDLPKYLELQGQIGNLDNYQEDDQINMDIQNPIQILNENIFFIQKWKNDSPIFKNQSNQVLKHNLKWKQYINHKKISQLRLNQIWNQLSQEVQLGIINYIKTNDIKFLTNLSIQKQQKLRKWIIFIKLEEAKKGIFKQIKGEINHLGQQYLKKQRPSNKQGQIQLTIKFPIQSYRMKRLFDILGNFKDDKNIQTQFKNICIKLKLDYQKLKKNVQSETKIQNNISKLEQIQDNAYNHQQTAYQQKSPANTNQVDGQKIYSIQQIINQIKITENLNLQISDQLQEIKSQNLRQQIMIFCQDTQKQYSSNLYKKIIKLWTKRDVNIWAKRYRCSKTKELPLSTIIAILDRANQLITTHRLRNTQKISLYLFLKSGQSQGQIGQIKTGQGKTTIISFLAAIKCFYGYKVDIITSNNVLAKQGADQKQQFYKLLGLTADNNNPVYGQQGERDCYKCDIVYGSISNFQFDYLRHQFQKENTFGNRIVRKNWLILDEVDSLIVDQGSNIAKLSSPFPGMESLRYVYLNIWAKMAKCQKALQNAYEQSVESQLKLLSEKLKNQEINIQQAEEHQNKIQQNFTNNFYDNLLKQMIKLTNEIINKDLMALNIHQFASRRFQKWVQNAYLAKYRYQQNSQYKLIQKEGQLEIIPVDNKNTGASMQNTILSNGIHQFLQLKHNLFLTYQSLTSCSISNVAYVKLYGSKISGLTGTLGSNAQMNLLHSIYRIDFFSMPTYIPKKFIEYPGVIVRKDKFNESISLAALGQVIQTQQRAPRAVLIICQTIGTALQIKIQLEQLIKKADLTSIEIKLFTDQNEASITKQVVKPGDIIIATNISGRGTDYKTTKQLQQNGGLHVIISFLPCNKRVQDQALGRTSRQGKKGSAQLIISEADIQDFDLDQSPDFKEVIGIRDQMEAERLVTIKNIKLTQINFQDQLFNKFCKIYSNLKLKTKTKFQWIYYLMDLKERWAFWLEEKSYNHSIISKTNIQKQYNEFLSVSNEITKGQVCWNPYYSIFIIDKYISMDMKKQAGIELNRVISTFKNSNFYYTLFMKGFQLQIMNGNQMIERYKNALCKILLFYDMQKNQKYKDYAYDYLLKAEKGISIQIQYLNSIINNQQLFQKIISQDESKYIQNEQQKQNILLKHLTGRFMALQIFKETIDTSKSQLKGKNALKQGVIIASRVPKSLSQLSKSDEDQKHITKYISQKQVDQLQFIGMDSVILLKQIHDVPNPIVISAQIQIAAGLALIGLCIPFPFLLPIKAPLAGVFIGQGITDIVMALIDQGEAGFSSGDYIKGKVISYGIALLTAGISSIMSSTKILKKAQSICQKLASKLRNAKNFKSICNWAAKKLQHLAQYIQFMITKINISRGVDQSSKILKLKDAKNVKKFLQLRQLVSHTTKFNNLTKLGKFGKLVTDIVKSTVINLSISIVSQKVMSLTLFKILDLLEDKVRTMVKTKIKQLCQQSSKIFSLMSGQQVNQRFQKMNFPPKDISSLLFMDILNIIKSGMNWKTQLTLFLGDICLNIKQLCFCVSRRFQQFIQKQVNVNKKSQKCNAKQVEERLTEMITIQLMNDLKSMSAKVITNTVTLAIKYKKQKKQKKYLKQIGQQIKDRQNQIKNAQIKAQNKKCGHQSLGNALGMNSQQISDASGMGVSQNGATIQQMKDVHKNIGIQNAEIMSCSNENKQQIVNKMKAKNSDRGVIFFTNHESPIGHSEAIYCGNDGKIRIGSTNGPQMGEYMARNAYSQDFQVLMGQNVNAENIQKLKVTANRNRIQFATNKLQGFVGRREGTRYGVNITSESNFKNADQPIIFDEQDMKKFRQQIKQKTSKQFNTRTTLINDLRIKNKQLQAEIQQLDLQKLDLDQDTKKDLQTTIDKKSKQLKQNYTKIYTSNKVINEIKQKGYDISGDKVKLKAHPDDKYVKDAAGKGTGISLHHIIPETKIKEGIYELIMDETEEKQPNITKQFNEFINKDINKTVKIQFLKKLQTQKKNIDNVLLKNFVASACQNGANISAGPLPHLRANDPGTGIDFQLLQAQKRIKLQKHLNKTDKNIFNKLTKVAKLQIHKQEKIFEPIKVIEKDKQMQKYKAVIRKKQ